MHQEGVRPFQLMVGSSDAADRTRIVDDARWAESVGFTHVAVLVEPLPELSFVVGVELLGVA